MVVPGGEEGASVSADVKTSFSPSSFVTDYCGLFNMVTNHVRGIDPWLGVCGLAPFKGQNSSLVQWQSMVPLGRTVTWQSLVEKRVRQI